MGLSSERRSVVVVGPVSPPANGMTMMTEVILGSSVRDEFRLCHVDTSDHREIAAVGRLDLRNVWLAMRHAFAFGVALLRRPALCYLPVARNRLGFLRDAALLLLARLARKPIVVHLHARGFSTFYQGERAWMRALVRLALGGRTWAVVLGESRRAEFDGLVPDHRVRVIPNGLPDPGLPVTPASEREPIVLHLASLGREKGAFTVLEAAHRLRNELPGARIVLAGDWRRLDEQHEAEAFVREHGLNGIVEFPGAVEGAAKASLLARAAVMAFPTSYAFEAHPLVVIEALASGMPVVATPVGCIPEMIGDGVEGFLVPEGDAEALASRLSLLLASHRLRASMGEAARRRFERDFTVSRFTGALAETWSDALEESAGTASYRRAAIAEESTR